MNGIIVINKPKDYTSHDVVNIIRKVANMKKVGHTGTLDPIASGVLVLCLGKATRISEYLLAGDKKYLADMEFGYETNSLDISGNITKRTDRLPSEEEVANILKNFLGDICQIPPMYSALKYKGKKLYEYAREGKEIDIKSRRVRIKDLKLIKKLSDNVYRIEVKCSSGTYIRSLIRDIGHELSSFATMVDLVRVKSADFTIDQAYDLEYIKKLNKDQIEGLLLDIDKSLSNMHSYEVADYFYKGITNGRIFNVDDSDLTLNEDMKIYCKNEFIGIGSYVEKDNNRGIKIKKMLKGD